MRRILLFVPIWLVGACTFPFLPVGPESTAPASAPERAADADGAADFNLGQDGTEALGLTVASREVQPVREKALGSVTTQFEPALLPAAVPGGSADVAAVGILQVGPASQTQILLGNPAPTTNIQTLVPNTPPPTLPPTLPPGGTPGGGIPPTGGGGSVPPPTTFPTATFLQAFSSSLSNLFGNRSAP